MNRLSRREFLKRSGTLAGAAGMALTSRAAPAERELAGRAFTLTNVLVRPSASSPVSGQLAPDAVTAIVGISRDARWYQVPGGFVPRESLQPILPYTRPALAEDLGRGFWAEVIAPISVVRQWCAGDAPVVARLAFGAVVYVVDRLVDDQEQVWYAISSTHESPQLGWAPALHYQPWQPPVARDASAS